jgi:RNA 2',3'-cyclic 3'-phosphodiesterase
MLRLFIAVDLPGEIQSDVEALMGHVHNARWVNSRQLHITLRFMGDTPEATLPALRDGLARVRQERFSLQLRGVGVFPPGHPRKPPRVLWLGIEPAGDLVRLKSVIDAALAGSPAAMASEQTFSPHLTLARFRQPPDRTLADFLEKYQDYKSPVWPVADFRLYQSTLRREGAIHAIVASYPLG